MKKSIKVLLLEDHDDDASLEIAMLKTHGYSVDWIRVETREEFCRILLEKNFDLIVARYDLPQFNALEAVRLVKKLKPFLPLIVISGKIGEEAVAQLMKEGAEDYLLKEHIQRLGDCVKQAVKRKHLKEEKTKIEESLKLSEEHYLQLAELSPYGVFIQQEGIFAYSNAAFRKMMKADAAQQILGKEVLQFIHPHDKEAVVRCIYQLLYLQSAVEWREETFLDLKNGELPVEIVAMPYKHGEKSGALVLVNDISSRKRAEEEIKNALIEKEVLLKEIYHRVKNNLQVISSLLNLHAQKIDNPAAKDALFENANRIKSIVIVHELLYQSKDVAKVNFNEYIENLIKYLFDAYAIDQKKISFEKEMDMIFLPIEKAVPCGLLIQEILANSLKYAFPSQEGKISILLKKTPTGIQLRLSDNGIGMNEEFFKNKLTLGLELIHALAQQLRGKLIKNFEAGSSYELFFPL
jgi:PAS domain S-box-containing protein